MNYIISFFFSFVFILSSANASIKPKPNLRDKIGQMLLIGFDGKKVNRRSSVIKFIQEDNIGGVILFDYDYQKKKFDKNIETPLQVKKLNQALKYYNSQGNTQHRRPQLPLLISVDYEGGKVNRLSPKYGYPQIPSAADVGKKTLPEAKYTAKLMSQVLKHGGFNLDFAPVLDINVNPDNPIVGKQDRSFSNDADTVVSYAGIYSEQFLKQKIQCAYKHFPGHGSSTQDSHLGFVDVTDTWQAYELKPYRDLFASQNACGMIMTAHVVNRQLDESGLPSTLSHKVLTGILRNQLQYKGVIITDDMQMKAISDNYGLEQAIVLAINAGADMMIFGNNLTVKSQDPKQIIDIIEANVVAGTISLDRINDAYQHIVSLKQSLKY